MAGSHAYGMSTPQSDIDIRGICVAPMRVRCGIYERFEQTEDDSFIDSDIGNIIEQKAGRSVLPDETIDCTIYDVSKAIKLIGDCNPNMLEIVFAHDNDVVFCNGVGDMLRDNQKLFLSLKAKHTYVGYATSQLKRIERHRAYLLGPIPTKPSRTDYGLPEHESVIPKDQRDLINEHIKGRIRSWGVDDLELSQAARITLNENLRAFRCSVLNCDDLKLDQKLEDSAAASLGIDESMRKALHAERSYRHALSEFRSYQRWETERNPKRKALEAQYGFDTKHASHLIRLARTGVELLETGTINVKRDDAEELLSIRRGARSFDELKEESEQLFSRMNVLYSENPCNLPKKPNFIALQQLYFDILGLE